METLRKEVSQAIERNIDPHDGISTISTTRDVLAVFEKYLTHNTFIHSVTDKINDGLDDSQVTEGDVRDAVTETIKGELVSWK